MLTGKLFRQFKNKDTPFQMEIFLMIFLSLKDSSGIDVDVRQSEPGKFWYLYHVLQWHRDCVF